MIVGFSIFRRDFGEPSIKELLGFGFSFIVRKFTDPTAYIRCFGDIVIRVARCRDCDKQHRHNQEHARDSEKTNCRPVAASQR